MKVTQVSIQPTEAAKASGSPSLTPELLAASAARYSRNNEGLESILSRIDPNNLDKSVDSIFRMIDYGHQSIADMVPVAMFMDNISIYLAYYVWTLCPTAGGQESSTRYIEINSDALVSPELLGIPEKLIPEWQKAMNKAFDSYKQALELWRQIGEIQPELTSIPQEILADKSPKGIKITARMSRNYRFDRARCYLPVAAATNMMLMMSARAWAQLCQHLSSHPLPEAKMLAENIRNELNLTSPRLMKHAHRTDSIANGMQAEFNNLSQHAATGLPATLIENATTTEPPPLVHVTVTPPSNLNSPPSTPHTSLSTLFPSDLQHHDNRYAWVGSTLCRTAVRFKCDAMSMGEIRDLNRHRTGNKYCPLIPQGFYSSLEQLPPDTTQISTQVEKLQEINMIGRDLSATAHNQLATGDPSYIHWTLLGTQYSFEHLTTADKFIYEAELRTGIGSHYRYAKHLKDALSEWYKQFPETKGLILEGDAEPE